jgi:hypothetical protein
MDLVAGNASVSMNLHRLPHQIQMIESGLIWRVGSCWLLSGALIWPMHEQHLIIFCLPLLFLFDYGLLVPELLLAPPFAYFLPPRLMFDSGVDWALGPELLLAPPFAYFLPPRFIFWINFQLISKSLILPVAYLSLLGNFCYAKILLCKFGALFLFLAYFLSYFELFTYFSLFQKHLFGQ